jgi:hypothetical protein
VVVGLKEDHTQTSALDKERERWRAEQAADPENEEHGEEFASDSLLSLVQEYGVGHASLDELVATDPMAWAMHSWPLYRRKTFLIAVFQTYIPQRDRRVSPFGGKVAAAAGDVEHGAER